MIVPSCGFDNAVHDRQAKPGAGLLGCEKWIENSIQNQPGVMPVPRCRESHKLKLLHNFTIPLPRRCRMLNKNPCPPFSLASAALQN